MKAVLRLQAKDRLPLQLNDCIDPGSCSDSCYVMSWMKNIFPVLQSMLIVLLTLIFLLPTPLSLRLLMPSVLLCKLMVQLVPLVLMLLDGEDCAPALASPLMIFALHWQLLQEGYVRVWLIQMAWQPSWQVGSIALSENPGVCPIGIGETASQFFSL